MKLRSEENTERIKFGINSIHCCNLRGCLCLPATLPGKDTPEIIVKMTTLIKI